MSRGTDKESKGLPARRRKSVRDQADWGTIDGELIRSVIEAVTRFGGAIRFGYSRDGGAYSLGVYGDGKPYSEFRAASDDVDDWLATIRDDYE